MEKIELIEKLNKISKKNLSPIRDMRIFFRLYFKHVNVFKLNYILRPVIAIFLLIFIPTSITAYAYNSNSVVYGSPLYGIKTNLENFISSNKIGLSKVKYYSTLLDKRLAEIQYLKSKNFNKVDNKIYLINVAYAADNTLRYNSAIANTILEISKINQKIKKEIVNIKDTNQKAEATKIFDTKKIKQKEIFNKIKKQKEFLIEDKKIDQNILKETIKAIDQVESTIEYNNINSTDNKINNIIAPEKDGVGNNQNIQHDNIDNIGKTNNKQNNKKENNKSDKHKQDTSIKVDNNQQENQNANTNTDTNTDNNTNTDNDTDNSSKEDMVPIIKQETITPIQEENKNNFQDNIVDTKKQEEINTNKDTISDINNKNIEPNTENIENKANN